MTEELSTSSLFRSEVAAHLARFHFTFPRFYIYCYNIRGYGSVKTANPETVLPILERSLHSSRGYQWPT